MPKYEFTLVWAGAGELTEELADQLYATGCDDGTPGQCKGNLTVDFHREAVSLEAAIRSAVADMRTAGCRVVHVQLEPDVVAPTS